MKRQPVCKVKNYHLVFLGSSHFEGLYLDLKELTLCPLLIIYRVYTDYCSVDASTGCSEIFHGDFPVPAAAV